MKKVHKRNDYYGELKRRLEENKKLYRETSVFTSFDSQFARFIASYLGVNPWRILVPISLLFSILIRLIFGKGYSEFVLAVFGGK